MQCQDYDYAGNIEDLELRIKRVRSIIIQLH